MSSLTVDGLRIAYELVGAGDAVDEVRCGAQGECDVRERSGGDEQHQPGYAQQTKGELPGACQREETGRVQQGNHGSRTSFCHSPSTRNNSPKRP